MKRAPMQQVSREGVRSVGWRGAQSSRFGALSLLLGALFISTAPACGDAGSEDGAESGGSTGTARGGSSGVGGTDGKDAGGGAGSAGRGASAGSGGSAGIGGGGCAGSAATGGSAGSGGSSATGGSAGTGAPGGGSGGSDAGTGTDGGISIDARMEGAGGSGGAAPDGGGCTPPNPSDPTITGYQNDIVARLTGQTDITPGVKIVNRATVANRQTARDYLKKLFQDLSLTALEHNYGSGTNVYAQLASTSGGTQAVVIGAHYDSGTVSPGANDNATGVAAVYAVARYAAQLPCRSKALIFALFDEEEVGLVGSEQFATKLKNDATMVHSVHTIDQMGWDQDCDRAIEATRVAARFGLPGTAIGVAQRSHAPARVCAAAR
jgi:hypothetical protein